MDRLHEPGVANGLRLRVHLGRTLMPRAKPSMRRSYPNCYRGLHLATFVALEGYRLVSLAFRLANRIHFNGFCHAF